MQNTDDSYNRFVNYYHANKDKLFTYLMYRLGFDREAAESSMMDIFLEAYENFNKFTQKNGSFDTWLFALAHSYVTSHPTKQVKEVPCQKEWEESHVGEADEMEYKMSEHIENKKVQYLFTLLKEGEREIISLRYLQGFSPKKISKIIGKKEVAVQLRVSQALQSLAKLYKKTYINF